MIFPRTLVLKSAKRTRPEFEPGSSRLYRYLWHVTCTTIQCQFKTRTAGYNKNAIVYILGQRSSLSFSTAPLQRVSSLTAFHPRIWRLFMLRSRISNSRLWSFAIVTIIDLPKDRNSFTWTDISYLFEETAIFGADNEMIGQIGLVLTWTTFIVTITW